MISGSEKMRKKGTRPRTKEKNRMSANLRHLRKFMKMNQKEFAELTGVSIATISNCENKKFVLSSSSVGKIIAAVGDNAYMLFEER